MKARTDQKLNKQNTTSTYTQTEPKTNNADSQTNFSIETKEIYEYCVNRVDPNTTNQEETHPNVEPPTMSGTYPRFEASHELIVEGLVATINKETKTEIQDNTP